MGRQWTGTFIRSLEHPEAGSKKLFDPSVPGFGIRLTKGAKTFIVQFGKKRTVRTIGKYPDITLREARTEAVQRLSRPEPLGRAMRRPELVRAFLEHSGANLRPNTTRRYRAALKKEIAEAVSPQEIAANKAMYNWGLRSGLVDHNPFQYKQAIFPVRDRLLTDDEVARLWNYEDGVFSDIVKMLIVTGQRRTQIASIIPSWIDGDTITFPRSLMKSKRPHSIPFNLLGASVIKPVKFNGWGKSKARIDRETGVEDWVLHDIRRYYSTTMAKIGVPLHITEHLLDHRGSTAGVQAIYMQYGFLPEMREAVKAYELHLTRIL